MSRLIIFIDGLPWIDKSFRERVDCAKFQRPMIPSYGYSVNLHHELFAGQNPVELGFFGDMSRVEGSKRKQGPIYLLLDQVRMRFPFFSRIVYKILGRLTKLKLAFIPPSIVHAFKFEGSYLLQSDNTLNIGKDEYAVICFDRTAKFGQRDQLAVKKCLKEIESGCENILVALTELDWVFHKNGFRSKKYSDKTADLARDVNLLSAKFLEKVPEGEIILVSDHGMADCHTGVDYKLESRFGMPFSDGVSYFYDSLYVHVWDDGNTELFCQMTDWLNERVEGRLITPHEREVYNISDRKFGDAIFALHAGFGFAPNYFGYSKLEAYHGHDPNELAMHGIFCSSRNKISNLEAFKTFDVAAYLKSAK